MKLNITEVYVLKQALGSINIKASDAPAVADLLSKLDKEFLRLQKLEEQKPTPKDDVVVAS